MTRNTPVPSPLWAPEGSPARAKREKLPEWDLTDLFPAPDSPELAEAIRTSRADSMAFETRYQGKLAALDGGALAAAISDYEALDEVLSRVMSYAGLLYAGDMTDPENGKFMQSMQETATEISSHLLFFELEINRIEDGRLDTRLGESEALRRYAPWLREIRAYREHQLDDQLEKLLLEKSVAGRAAWNRLFDETMADLRFDVELPDGTREMTSAEVLNLLSDSDGAVRKAAAKSLGAVLGKNARTFTLITNTLAKDKEIEDKWRGFARPVSSRNLANVVEDEVVDALVTAVRSAYPDLSHRYYALKAKWFGVDQLDYWDRNAPLPDDDDTKIHWGDAVTKVLDAYGRFSPELAEVAQDFFDNDWIDAPVRPGKSPGAFAHPTVPGAHPYLLLNYQGKTRDVMTLAHELGHGVHQVLAAGQGHLMSDTPLTLAETASVFGEMLTFRKLLSEADSPALRKTMLASKVEDMLNTVVRQIAFHEFERRLHDKRAEGELLTEEICDIWMEIQAESLGPAIRFEDEYRYFWTYIPHFIHSPFYVYAYAFGDCLVNSLYGVYQGSADGFAERYLDMLRAGGTLRHKELLAPFGLDASDPAFWQRGLDVISGLIDELEALDS
ncbi:MAG: M3 family oligoendopeptidase [Rhodospirillaceae bacterium]|jgi:oligoendopeptidase F|nr:M3 family oligoendopeptidase [Rhodospirillaceae bacterium]MBT4771604.1 M3 family oligoendopeptidase [Rhodospirillaceae bacterium]MBT5357337.1 M3 family oligoendopeptidase [Rhodospirillaceae bacterium]MBT6311429.1 M3 family oligoendopeptidase [Rhodospirillaceae bacterium]MBT7363537.1 M3 family oligoendopeptidase [Rhodospirillaceae bacterium]